MAPPISTSDTLEDLLPTIEVNNQHEDVYLNVCKIFEKVVAEDIDITTKEGITGVQNCLRVLNHALKGQYQMSAETRGKLVTLIFKFLSRKEGNKRLQSSLMTICTLLINTKYDKSQLPSGYVIDGKPLYQLVEPYIEQQSIFVREKTEYSSMIFTDYIKKLHALIKSASKYFTKEFSLWVLQKGQELIATHASRITARSYMGLGLVETFFHVESNIEVINDSFLVFIMDLFQYSETLTSGAWRASILSLLMQLIMVPKYQKKFAKKYLKMFYGVITTLVHSNNRQKVSSRYDTSGAIKLILDSAVLPWKAIAVIVVATIEYDDKIKREEATVQMPLEELKTMETSGMSLGMILFQQLVQSIETEFHPSTRVHFNAAGQFIQQVAVAFAKGVGITLAEKNSNCYETSEFVDANSFHLTKYQLGFNDTIKLKIFFVNLLLPLVLNSMYHRSHHFVESSMKILALLVQLDASAVQKKLLPQIYRALDPEESLSHAHQAQPALRALTYTFWHFSKENLPEIVPHLHDILSLALPGIDSNDGMKTLHAMNFFTMFFGCFPLVDCSGDEWIWEALDDEEGEKFTDEEWLRVKSTTAFFEEFAVTFLNHMLRYAEKTGKENGQIDGGLSDDSNKSASSENYGILGISGGLCLRFFFSNMSPCIRKVVVTELVKHVLSTASEMTMTYDYLLKFAGRYEPNVVLDSLVTSIKMKMFKNSDVLKKGLALENSVTEAVLDDALSSTSHVWYLKVLDSSCKSCGDVCLQHSGFYIQVLKHSLYNTSEKVRSASVNLFKSLVHNLLSHFVINEAYIINIFGAQGNTQVKNKNMKYLYSRTCKRKEMNLNWHIPSTKEIEFVQLLISTFLNKSIGSLEVLLKEPFIKLKNVLDEWKHNLDILICIMEGVSINKDIAKPLKIRLSTLCNVVFEYFGNDENSDPKILKKVIKLSTITISSNAATSDSSAGRVQIYFFDALNKIATNRIDMAHWLHLLKHSKDTNDLKHDRPFPVFISVLMAESRQVRRILDRDEYTVEPYKHEHKIMKKLAEKLILDVSKHVYRDVRMETCMALDEIITNRDDLCTKCCKSLVGSLKKASASNSHALGTLSVLMKKRILFSMRHDWELLKDFYVAAISPTFIDSLSEDKKLEAQTILRSIIVAIAEIREKCVPGLNAESWNIFASELIKTKLYIEIDDMRWWHIMVASAYMFLSLPKLQNEKDVNAGNNGDLINSWFLNLIKRQELPLRRLALSSFAFESIRVKNEDKDKIDVDAILDAILQNHDDPRDANAPRSIWTPGVHQLLLLAGQGNFNGSGSKYASSWGTFKVGHAIVASNFQLGNNEQYRGRVLEYFNRLLEKADSEGIDKKTCNAISEIFAGCVRSGNDLVINKDALQSLQPIVEKAIALTPLSWIHTWSVAYVAIAENRNCYEFTFDVVINKLKEEFDNSASSNRDAFSADDTTGSKDVNLIVSSDGNYNNNEETSFSGPSKWLYILSGMLQELAGYDDNAVGRKLTTYSMDQSKALILRGVRSAFDSCRKNAAKCLAWLCIVASVHGAESVESRIQEMIKVDMGSEDSSNACIESACHLIKSLAQFGPTEYSKKYIVNLLNATMKFQNASAAGGKNAEKVALARNTAIVAANILVFTPAAFDNLKKYNNEFNTVLEFVFNGLKHSSYHHRVAALAFLNIFYKKNVHTFGYEQNTKLIGMVKDRLNDKRPEVQECAQAVLMMMLLFINKKEQKNMCEIFSTMASTKVPKNKEKFPNKVKKAYRKRVAGVLGLSAIVERNPYTIPDFVPDALVLMCQVASDPGSANGIIKRSLANFKRSHNDEWDEHKSAFTSSQLDWLQDFFLPNNYYA